MVLPSPQIYINVESPLPRDLERVLAEEGDRHSAILISDFVPLLLGSASHANELIQPHTPVPELTDSLSFNDIAEVLRAG